MMAWLKLNEIRSVIKKGEFFKKANILERVAEEVLQWDVFYNSYENLIKLPNIY